MKIKHLFLAGLAAVALSACSDDDKDQLVPGTGVEGYLSLTIKDASLTRTAEGTEGREAGVGAENTIDKVTVVLTDDAGIIKDFVQDLTPAGGKVLAKATTGTHRLYALVNPPTDITLATGDDIQRVITVADSIEAANGYKSGKFLMVNQKHDAASNAGVSVSITSANTEHTPAQATVFVDRVAVKIVPKTSSPTVNITTDPANFITGVTVEGYLPLNVNKKFNLVQAWGTDNLNGTTLSSEALQTPLFPGGATDLVKDQYFYNISAYTALKRDDTGKPDSITSIEDLTLSGVTFNAIDAPFYATENRPTILTYDTPAKPTAGRGETTGIIYKVKAVGPTGTFYAYDGKVYADMTSLEAAYGSTLGSFSIPELRAKGVKVYEDGIMYYTYFIKGTNNNANHLFGGSGGENYYGVFRNSVYNLTINKIEALGDDVPGGGQVDPNKPGEPGNPPIDADKAYIQVSVTVNDWVLNTIDIDF